MSCELEISDVQHVNKHISEIPTGFQNEKEEIINVNIRLTSRSCDTRFTAVLPLP